MSKKYFFVCYVSYKLAGAGYAGYANYTDILDHPITIDDINNISEFSKRSIRSSHPLAEDLTSTVTFYSEIN